MSVSIELKPAKRVVSKAFDGGAAMNAMLLKRMNAADFAKSLAVAEGLLEYGVPQVDVQAIVGLPQKVVAAAARKTEVVAPRAGRRPTGMGKIFATPSNHLRASIFLAAVDNLAPGLRNQEEIVTGEVLLSALRHTDMVCGPMSDEHVGVRYYLTAVHKLSEGKVYLMTCGACGVRHVRTRESIRSNGASLIGGECPYCQYLRWLKAKSKKKIAEAATKKPENAEAQDAMDFDAAPMKGDVSPEAGRAAYQALMS